MAFDTTTQLPQRMELQRQIFGEFSTERGVVHMNDSITQYNILSYDPIFEMLLVTSLLVYILWLRNYMNISHNERDQERHIGNKFFLWFMALGVAIIYTTKVIDMVIAMGFIDRISQFNIFSVVEDLGFGLWSGGVAATFIFWLFWSSTVLWVANRLSDSDWLFSKIMALRDSTMRTSVLIGTPFVLLCGLERSDYIMFYITLTIFSFILIYYLLRSFMLFRSKKISNLNWFLYLCTVEILPFTIMWAFFTRSVT